jgi:hypothetical protein
MTGKQKTLATSARVLAANERKRVSGLPLQVTRAQVGRAVLYTIKPEQFDLLHVDPRYQRGKLEKEINQLIYVLKNGGIIPVPIQIVQRKNGSWWIIDGQQRFEAHRRCTLPIDALLYKFDDPSVEALMFLIGNRGVRLSANLTVFAWQGPSGFFLRKEVAKAGSPFHNLVNFGSVADRKKPYPAALLLRVLCTVVAPSYSRALGPAQTLLENLDALMTVPGAPERLDAMLRLIPLVFPATMTTFRYLPAVALGVMARERWMEDVEFPNSAITAKLAKIDWKHVAPSHSMRFLPVMKDEIAKYWK